MCRRHRLLFSAGMVIATSFCARVWSSDIPAIQSGTQLPAVVKVELQTTRQSTAGTQIGIQQPVRPANATSDQYCGAGSIKVVPVSRMSMGNFHDSLVDRGPVMNQSYYGQNESFPHRTGPIGRSHQHVRQVTTESRNAVIGWFCYIKGNGPAIWKMDEGVRSPAVYQVPKWH